MKSIPREVQVYENENGQVPFDEWMESLRDARTRSIIDARLARLELGNVGDSAAVGSGVSELRIDFGPGYRVYYGEDGPSLILLLIAGDKKSQSKDIRIAKAYWQDYKEGKK